VRLEGENCIKESLPHFVGESALYGFHQPVCCSGKGELNEPLLFLPLCVGGDDTPVGMIEGGSDVVGRVPRNEGGFIYNGLVRFGEGGALSGLGVCFDNVSKGAFFAKQFVQFSDAFRSAIQF
jgi:hypothetical protein